MSAVKKKRCPGCGGFCGGNGRRAGCKFAANEAKRQADAMWEYAKASVVPRRAGAQAKTQGVAGQDGAA